MKIYVELLTHSSAWKLIVLLFSLSLSPSLFHNEIDMLYNLKSRNYTIMHFSHASLCHMYYIDNNSIRWHWLSITSSHYSCSTRFLMSNWIDYVDVNETLSDMWQNASSSTTHLFINENCVIDRRRYLIVWLQLIDFQIFSHHFQTYRTTTLCENDIDVTIQQKLSSNHTLQKKRRKEANPFITLNAC